MYYSIVHTRLIHASDMFVHVYARWVGFQMSMYSVTYFCLEYVPVHTRGKRYILEGKRYVLDGKGTFFGLKVYTFRVKYQLCTGMYQYIL